MIPKKIKLIGIVLVSFIPQIQGAHASISGPAACGEGTALTSIPPAAIRCDSISCTSCADDEDPDTCSTRTMYTNCIYPNDPNPFGLSFSVTPPNTVASSNEVDVSVGDTVIYAWQSSGPNVSLSSTYSIVAGPNACGFPVAPPSAPQTPWAIGAQSPSYGQIQSVIQPCQSGTTYKMRLKAVSGSNETFKEITVRVRETRNIEFYTRVPSIRGGEILLNQDLFLKAGDVVSYFWNAPGSIGMSSSYEASGIHRCAWPSQGRWVAQQPSGQYLNSTLVACQRGGVYVLTITAFYSDRPPQSKFIRVHVAE